MAFFATVLKNKYYIQSVCYGFQNFPDELFGLKLNSYYRELQRQ